MTAHTYLHLKDFYKGVLGKNKSAWIEYTGWRVQIISSGEREECITLLTPSPVYVTVIYFFIII